MKNKNGFIATGLIYSFFLIFLTLFLTVIINNMNNKIYLGELEASIKSDLNSYKYVRDFNPGDLISFVDDCTNAGNFIVDNSYVVASVNTNILGEDDHLVLYSYGVVGPVGSVVGIDYVDENDILTDISTGYRNATFINKILYDFDSSTNTIYSLGNRKAIELYTTNDCAYDETEEKNIFCTDKGKIIVLSGNRMIRYREVYKPVDHNVETCNIEDAMGVIYVKDSI